MYGLLMGVSATDTSMPADRLFEYTEASVRAPIEADLRQLTQMPVLVMPEIKDPSRPQVARVGRVDNVVSSGRTIRYRFVVDADIPEIPSSVIESLAPALAIDDQPWGEFTRTHWAVKDVDLYRALLSRPRATTILAPMVFTITSNAPTPRLVSFMMPLDSSFTPVYQAMLQGVTQHDWRASRAADLSTNGPIIQEIVDLIATSQVVICDLSGRNPNVFYEAGIAHTMGKEVILLASHKSDVPFDLQHLRYIPYVNNGQGIDALVAHVLRHLDTISSRALS